MKRLILFFSLVLIALSWNVSAQQYLVDESTAALWHMNENIGEVIYDATNNRNNGDIFNVADWVTMGRYSCGLRLNGYDDFIRVVNSDSLRIESDFTWEMWIKKTSNSDMMLFSKEGEFGEFTSPFYVSIKDNILHGEIVTELGSAHVTGLTELQVNQWHHVALTYDGLTLKLYLDGQLDGLALATGDLVDTSNSFFIGFGEQQQGYGNFKGIIDEVRVSNVARETFNLGGDSYNSFRCQSGGHDLFIP